jgi:hypothetical protein
MYSSFNVKGPWHPRGGELGNLKISSKAMASNFHLVKTYAMNKLSRYATKVLLDVLLSLTQKSYANLVQPYH